MLHYLRWPDFLVICLNIGAMIAIGIYTSRKSKSSEAYFLAGRRMPGWVVGISLMSTIISSMTFLAMPGFAFQEDWRYVPGHMTYLIANLAALFLFMPFFRAGRFPSAYAYLERRFGTWARLYAGAGFILFQVFRLGVILYGRVAGHRDPERVSASPHHRGLRRAGGVLHHGRRAGGGDLDRRAAGCGPWWEAVSSAFRWWPTLLPGGLEQILTEASAAGKFSIGSTHFSWDEKTLWVTTLLYFFLFLQIMSTDQMTVQRYSAMKTDREARKGVILGAFSTVSVWLYFTFVGTALYVFYNHFPAPELSGMAPEQVFPLLHPHPRCRRVWPA